VSSAYRQNCQNQEEGSFGGFGGCIFPGKVENGGQSSKIATAKTVETVATRGTE